MNKAYLWIDECSIINKLVGNLNTKGYCITAGKAGTSNFISANIDGKTKITAEELIKIAVLKTSYEIYYQNKKRLGKILYGYGTINTDHSVKAMN